jgi:hypothetical protein
MISIKALWIAAPSTNTVISSNGSLFLFFGVMLFEKESVEVSDWVFLRVSVTLGIALPKRNS